jgi:hypothetical protein
MARAVGELAAEPKLALIEVQSGSPTIRIDCKGLAEIVKELTAFIMEAWHKVRHKRAEELLEKNSALLSTLGVVEVIERRRSAGELGAEEAESLKRTLVESTLGMFGCNALPTEIHRREFVNNDKLLAQFSPKLLTAGAQQVADEKANPARRKRKPRQKRSPEQSTGPTPAVVREPEEHDPDDADG